MHITIIYKPHQFHMWDTFPIASSCPKHHSYVRGPSYRCCHNRARMLANLLVHVINQNPPGSRIGSAVWAKRYHISSQEMTSCCGKTAIAISLPGQLIPGQVYMQASASACGQLHSPKVHSPRMALSPSSAMLM